MERHQARNWFEVTSEDSTSFLSFIILALLVVVGIINIGLPFYLVHRKDREDKNDTKNMQVHEAAKHNVVPWHMEKEIKQKANALKKEMKKEKQRKKRETEPTEADTATTQKTI